MWKSFVLCTFLLTAAPHVEDLPVFFVFCFLNFGFYFESDFHFVLFTCLRCWLSCVFNPASILLTCNVEVLIFVFYPLRRLSWYRGIF